MGHFKSSTHCVFSLKVNLFYKIHLQAFKVISIVLYHSGPTFGQVQYCCQDAFVVGASDYWGVTSLDTSSMLRKRFTRNGFFNFGNKSKAGGLMSGLYVRLGKRLPSILFQNFRYCTWGMRPRVNVWSLVTARDLTPVSSSILRLRFAEQGPRSLPIRAHCSLLKSGSQLSRKSERLHHPTGRASAVCRNFEMAYV